LIELAKTEQLSPRYIARHLELAFLAPRIVEAILDGQQPPTLSLQMLKQLELPLCWQEQEKLLGFG
jgi:site-specific DNA recombinase